MKFALTKNDGINFKRSNIFSAAREPILYLFNFLCRATSAFLCGYRRSSGTACPSYRKKCKRFYRYLTMPEYSYLSQIFGAMLPCELRISETFYGSGELFLFTFFPTFKVRTLHAHRFQRNQSINQSIYYFCRQPVPD